MGLAGGQNLAGPSPTGKVLMSIGILMFAGVVLFQMVTLPVEFDATRRAKAVLAQSGIVQTPEEAQGVNKVLDAAALTYVAAALAGALQLIAPHPPRQPTTELTRRPLPWRATSKHGAIRSARIAPLLCAALLCGCRTPPAHPAAPRAPAEPLPAPRVASAEAVRYTLELLDPDAPLVAIHVEARGDADGESEFTLDEGWAGIAESGKDLELVEARGRTTRSRASA